MDLKSDWKVLSYSKIPSHQVNFLNKSMVIAVKSSAAPVVFKLQEIKKVKQVQVKGRLDGRLRLEGLQGEKNADDFYLRLGLVVIGDRRLSFMERALAPTWVRELYKLVPKGLGVKNIEFFNIYTDPRIADQKRVHPQSKLLKENNVWFLDNEGEFSFSTDLKTELEIGAIWISVDGDDTRSEYKLTINEIGLL